MAIQERSMGKIEITPFLKWAGGKRWLGRTFSDQFPHSFDTYREPFLGGAAIFFSLHPKRGRLSDSNAELINSYKAIKRDWRSVLSMLQAHSKLHSNDYYYYIRGETPSNSIERAARFLYLNRTCWNGLYRVNLKGEFNVPRGTKDLVLLPTDNFSEISKRLTNFALDCCDFEVAMENVSGRDFVYIDPPYTVKHNNNGFLKYNERIFSWDDQVRLAAAVDRAASRGAKILISQADHSSIRELYRGIGSFSATRRSSVIAASASRRGSVSELLIRVNY